MGPAPSGRLLAAALALAALADAPARAQQSAGGERQSAAAGGGEPTEPTAAELMDQLMWGNVPVGGPFTLTGHDGRKRSDADFRGKLVLLYFGYMYCPDVCPTDLQMMAQAIDQLGPEGDRVQPAFVTLDPERDTVEAMRQYVASFHPRLVGLTGTPGEIKAVARAYKVHYRKVRDPAATSYTLDHSAFIYLLDWEGRYLGFFPPGTKPDRMLEVVRPFLAKMPAR